MKGEEAEKGPHQGTPRTGTGHGDRENKAKAAPAGMGPAQGTVKAFKSGQMRGSSKERDSNKNQAASLHMQLAYVLANTFGIFIHTSGDKKMIVGFQVLTVYEEHLDEVITFV